MKESGIRIRRMDLERIYTLMEQSMWANGYLTSSMAEEKSLGLTEQFMRVTTSQDRNMV